MSHTDPAAAQIEASDRRPSTILRDPWIVCAMVAAALLELWRLDRAALWYDEIFTAQWVALSWGEMFRTALLGDYGANHLPCYFVVLKLWTALAGQSPWALRLPGVFFGTAAVAGTAALAGTLVDRHAARVVAWLTAMSPFLLHHAQEARMYALIVALAAFSLLLLARYLRGFAPRLGVAFVLVDSALLGTHYYAMFFVAGQLLALLWLWPRPLRAWLPAALVIVLAIAAGPVLAALTIAGHEAGGSYELGLAAFPGLLWSLVAGYSLLPTSEALHTEGLRAALPYVPLALLGAAAVFVLATIAWHRLNREGRILLLATIGMVVVAPFAVSLLRPVAVNPRYAAAAVPALLTLLGCGIPNRLRSDFTTIAATTLVVIFALGSALHLAQPGHGREDVASAGAWLAQRVPAQHEIAITSSEMADLACFHWPSRTVRLYPLRKQLITRANAEQYAAAFPFGTDDQAIYVIGRAWLSDPDSALVQALQARYRPCAGASFAGIRVLCLQRPQAAQLSAAPAADPPPASVVVDCRRPR